MDEIRIKAYKRLLKYLVDAGRGIAYHKSNPIEPERIAYLGDLCYLMHNLATANYTNAWDDFVEKYFWDSWEFLKEKSAYKAYFENLKAVFEEELLSATEEEQP